MKFFSTVASLVAVANASPLNYALAPQATVVHPGSVHVQDHIAPAGPAVAKTYVQHGVVGHQTVQVGTQQVQVGHQYNVAGQTVHERPAYTYVAEPAKESESTVALPAPALPVAAAPGAIPVIKPYTNQGPAPADTVTVQKILAPARTHTRITPQVTRIQPKLQVNKVPYEVVVNEPVAVPREVVVEKRVEKPVHVEVPYPVHTPEYYKVHPVQEVVRQPVIHKHTTSVHTPGYVAAAPVAAVAAAPAVAVAPAYAAAPIAHKY